MEASEVRIRLSMVTQRLYVRVKGGMFEDDFEIPWDELSDGMKNWYIKLASRLWP